jgi:peptidoglycan DL-endopeptidase LytF
MRRHNRSILHGRPIRHRRAEGLWSLPFRFHGRILSHVVVVILVISAILLERSLPQSYLANHGVLQAAPDLAEASGSGVTSLSVAGLTATGTSAEGITKPVSNMPVATSSQPGEGAWARALSVSIEPAPALSPTADAKRDAKATPETGHAGQEVPIPSPTPTSGGNVASYQIQTFSVQSGDTLLDIAARFGITPETVLWANNLGNGQFLSIGQQLTIPPVSGVLHRVRNGDTPGSVAETYGADVARIVEINHLTNLATIQEGQLLIVPDGIPRTVEAIDGPPAAPSHQEIVSAPKYTVVSGDSLVSIADAFHVKPSAIQAANGMLDPDKLKIGDVLAIPGGVQPTSAAAAPPEPTRAAPREKPGDSPSADTSKYVVRRGDSLSSIALALGVDAAVLQQANGLSDPNQLKEGQTLTVQGGRQPVAATPVPSKAGPTKPAATTVPPAPTQAAKVASPTPRPAVAPAQGGNGGDRVAAAAMKYLGYRYVWGGQSPAGFDCSGFTWYVYKEAGISIPIHDPAGQLNAGRKVSRDALLPGDLVFFQNTYQAGLSHVGVYLGGGRFINAESESVGVQVRSISDPYWSSRYVGASRPW